MTRETKRSKRARYKEANDNESPRCSLPPARGQSDSLALHHSTTTTSNPKRGWKAPLQQQRRSYSLPPCSPILPTPAFAVNGKINCLSAVYFHPVRTDIDFFNPSDCFSPLFVHHFFGAKEEVQNLSQLCVRIFFTVDTVDVFVDVKGTRIPPTTTDDASLLSPEEEAAIIKARIVGHLLRVPFPGGFHESVESFLAVVNSEGRRRFEPPGQTVGILKDRNGHEIMIRQCQFDGNSFESRQFALYHRRVEWFLHFFIDACSNIERDAQWTILLPYYIRKNEDRNVCAGAATHGKVTASVPPITSNREIEPAAELCGVATLYRFLAFPLGRRRISQFMVFPHLQRKDIGLQLLEWIYIDTLRDPSIAELTVEDPAISFRQLRDVVGLKLALRTRAIQPVDMFPPLTHLSADNPCIQLSQALQERKEDQADKCRKHHNLQSNVSDDAWRHLPRTNIDEPGFKATLKQAIKESPKQAVRLLELLRVARVLPYPMPSPPEFELDETTREWRTCVRSTMSSSGLRVWESQQVEMNRQPAREVRTVPDKLEDSALLRQVRLKIKRRIRLDRLEEFATCSVAEQRQELAIAWNRLYASFYRSIRKVRELILSGQCTMEPLVLPD